MKVRELKLLPILVYRWLSKQYHAIFASSIPADWKALENFYPELTVDNLDESIGRMRTSILEFTLANDIRQAWYTPFFLTTDYSFGECRDVSDDEYEQGAALELDLLFSGNNFPRCERELEEMKRDVSAISACL